MCALIARMMSDDCRKTAQRIGQFMQHIRLGETNEKIVVCMVLRKLNL